MIGQDPANVGSFLDDPDGVRFVAGEDPPSMSLDPSDGAGFDADPGGASVLAEQGAQAGREAAAELATADYLDGQEAARVA